MKLSKSHLVVAVLAALATVAVMEVGSALHTTWLGITGELPADHPGAHKAKAKAKAAKPSPSGKPTPANKPAHQGRPTPSPEAVAAARKAWWDGLTEEEKDARRRAARAKRTGISEEERRAHREAAAAERAKRRAAGENAPEPDEESDLPDTDM